MTFAKTFLFAVLAAITFAVPATESRSGCTFVFLRPETSSFWHTVTNGTLTVPVDFPEGASSAVLTVSGIGYRKVYPEITTATVSFDLPTPVKAEDENVYELSLAFDDGTVRTARLGYVTGHAAGARAPARCLLSVGTRAWNRVKKRAVLPIPYGTRTIAVDGVETGPYVYGTDWRTLPTRPMYGWKGCTVPIWNKDFFNAFEYLREAANGMLNAQLSGKKPSREIEETFERVFGTLEYDRVTSIAGIVHALLAYWIRENGEFDGGCRLDPESR